MCWKSDQASADHSSSEFQEVVHKYHFYLVSILMQSYGIYILGERYFFSKMASEACESTPGVTIILTVKDQQRTIARAIESLQSIDYPDYDIVVVDGGSEDQTVTIAREHSVRTIQTVDSAPGQGRNRGIVDTSSQIVAFIDGDCCVEAVSWLRDCVRLLGQDEIGGVGGPVVPYAGAPYMSKALMNALSTYLANAGSAQFARYRKQTEVRSIPTCNAVYRREAIERAGLFAEDLRYCEDADLNYRIRKLGYHLVYSPNIVVQHDWKVSSFTSLFRYMITYGAGRCIAAKRHTHLFSPLQVLPSFALACAFLLFALSLVLHGIFDYVTLVLVSSYFALVFASAFLAAYQFRDVKMVLLAPIAYVLVHVGYGVGFILGLFNCGVG